MDTWSNEIRQGSKTMKSEKGGIFNKSIGWKDNLQKNYKPYIR